jgi:hypothetical protein
MATQLDKLNQAVLGDIRQRLGAKDENDTSHDEQISRMSANEMFDEWCNWNGLIDWGPDLRHTLDHLRKVVSDN